MTKFYPLGAIQTEEDLEHHFLSPVYIVWASGMNTTIQKYFVTGLTVKNNILAPSVRQIRAVAENSHTELGWIDTEIYPRDVNIGASYNDYFIFSSLDDAKSYASWKKLGG